MLSGVFEADDLTDADKLNALLGGVDGFDQDEACGDCDD